MLEPEELGRLMERALQEGREPTLLASRRGQPVSGRPSGHSPSTPAALRASCSGVRGRTSTWSVACRWSGETWPKSGIAPRRL